MPAEKQSLETQPKVGRWFRDLRIRRMVSQTILLGLGRGAGKLLSFVAFVLTARALGPKSFGLLAFAMSVASLLMFLPNMGGDPYYCREVARGRECRRGLLRRILGLKLAGSAVFLLFFPLILRLTSSQASFQTVACLALAFVFLCFTETWRAVLITAEKPGSAGVLDVMQSAGFLILVWLFVRYHPSPESAAFTFALSQIGSVVLGAVLVWRLLRHHPLTASNRTWRSVFAATLPLMAIWMFSDLYLRVDTAMIYLFKGEAETGYYAASYRLVEGLCSATLVLCAVVLPRMSKGWGSGLKSWAYEWRQSSTALICLVALPALLFWVVPGTIIGHLYGLQFMRAAASLKVLGPASAILCFGYLQGSALTSIGLERRQLAITAAGLSANVGLNLWLIPWLGGVGAAWATLGSAVLYVTLAQWSLSHARRRAHVAANWSAAQGRTAAEQPSAKCAILISSAAIGGAERYLVELATSMSRSPMRPVFINLKPGVAYRPDLESNAVPVVSGVSPHRLNPLGALRLASILLRLKPDVLFINSNRQAMWLGTVVGRLCRVPLILIHSHDHLDAHIGILRSAARWTDGIIAASHGHRTLLCRNHGFDPRRVKTVYPGIDLNRTRRTEARTERAVPHSPVVGIVAALRPEKDHETFLQAAAAIKKEAPNVRFRIIGDGPRKPALQNLAVQLDIGDATEFAGWQAVNAELLSQLDVLVLSSASETFPAVILESFSAGLPVVATDVGSVAEMFSSEEYGLLVPPRDPVALGDAVVRLLKDPEGARAMSERACRAVEFYSSDRFCADLVRTFGQMRDAKSSGSLSATEELLES